MVKAKEIITKKTVIVIEEEDKENYKFIKMKTKDLYRDKEDVYAIHYSEIEEINKKDGEIKEAYRIKKINGLQGLQLLYNLRDLEVQKITGKKILSNLTIKLLEALQGENENSWLKPLNLDKEESSELERIGVYHRTS